MCISCATMQNLKNRICSTHALDIKPYSREHITCREVNSSINSHSRSRSYIRFRRRHQNETKECATRVASARHMLPTTESVYTDILTGCRGLSLRAPYIVLHYVYALGCSTFNARTSSPRGRSDVHAWWKRITCMYIALNAVLGHAHLWDTRRHTTTYNIPTHQKCGYNLT